MNEFSYIFLIFLLFGTGLQIWLAQRHRTYVTKHKKSVPAAFAEKISLEDHQKAAAYTLAKTSFAQKMFIFENLGNKT